MKCSACVLLPALLGIGLVKAAPSPHQREVVQFRCERGAVWMENCNACRCESGDHVVCTHMACLENALTVLDPVPEPASSDCYQGPCPDECQHRVDDSGCHTCACRQDGSDQTSDGDAEKWGFLAIASSLAPGK